MRQEINLYQAVLQPARLRWSVGYLKNAVLITLLVMLLMEGVGQFRQRQLQSEIDSIQQSLNHDQVKLTELETKYPKPEQDPKLVSYFKQLDDERRQKLQILTLLSNEQYGNTRGFADHLAGLSRQHVQGMWLTLISIDQGGASLAIAGGSLQAELVPQFIQRLGNETSFVGKEFKTFQLTRADEKQRWVSFEMNTKAVAGSRQ